MMSPICDTICDTMYSWKVKFSLNAMIDITELLNFDALFFLSWANKQYRLKVFHEHNEFWKFLDSILFTFISAGNI